MSAEVRVRLAEPRDVEAGVDLYAVVAAEGIHIGGEAPVDKPARRDRWRDSLARQDSAAFVAEAGGRMVGWASLEGDRVAELGMFVAPEWRGRGVGRTLLEACVAWARAAGAHKIALQVWPHNVAARRLYESFGFEQEGYLRRHYRRRNGELWDAIVMGLLLNRAPEDDARSEPARYPAAPGTATPRHERESSEEMRDPDAADR
jgi:RimJ/RimL family protein N-acetyltransferase